MQSPTSNQRTEHSETLAKLSQSIQRFRKQKGLKLEDLAAISDISASSLSQLERGIGNPSFFTLTKIAQALSIPLTYLFGEENGIRSGIVRADNRKRLIPPNSDLVYELITPDLNRSFEVVLIEIDPGTPEPDSPFNHEGEECILVLEGELSFHLGNEVHKLSAGDSITFSSHVPHWSENISRKTTQLIVIISPPAF
jgi:transcriptional regulator with XRE-family HTH domain